LTHTQVILFCFNVDCCFLREISSFQVANHKKLLKYKVKPVYNDHPWDPEKVAIVQGLVQNTR
jgi:hypothetical protein